MIISAGPTNSSLPRGCSPWLRPGSWRANPDEETTDWRAVCGRTARTVRRAGTARAVSDPYQSRSDRTSLFSRTWYFLRSGNDEAYFAGLFRFSPPAQLLLFLRTESGGLLKNIKRAGE